MKCGRCDKQKHKAGLGVAQAAWRSGTRGTTQNSFTRWSHGNVGAIAVGENLKCVFLSYVAFTKEITPNQPQLLSFTPWLQSVVDSHSWRRRGRLVSPVSFLHFHHKRSWCIGNSHRNLQARPRDDVYVTPTLADGQSFNINRRAGDLLGAVLATSTLSESRRCCRMEVRWNVHYKNNQNIETEQKDEAWIIY